MMKVTYRLKLGQDEFSLEAEVKDEKQFFETMSFYSNLPKSAPGGATDLKLVFRTTKKGHKYYSLISDSEKMEFKLGQNLEANGGGLFPKGWGPAFGADEDEGQEQPQAQTQRSAPITVGAAPQQRNQPPVNPIQPPMPQQFAPPTPQYVAPAPAPMQPPTPSQPVPTQQAAPVNPQVTNVANNVLARFGINK